MSKYKRLDKVIINFKKDVLIDEVFTQFEYNLYNEKVGMILDCYDNYYEVWIYGQDVINVKEDMLDMYVSSTETKYTDSTKDMLRFNIETIQKKSPILLTEDTYEYDYYLDLPKKQYKIIECDKEGVKMDIEIGDKVKNINSQKLGIVIRIFESGSIAVLENIAPTVITTHDNDKTLKIEEKNCIDIFDETKKGDK